MKRSSFFLLGFTLVVTGCVPAIIRRPSPPAPAVPATHIAVNTAGPWVLAAAASQRVTIDTRAVVTIASDTLTRVDTVQATLGASFVWASAARRRVDGLLADYRVSIGGAPPAAPAGLQVNRPFSAARAAASEGMSFTLPVESSACTDPALSALQGLHEAWIPLPDTLVIGQEWADTVHTLSCRDRIPLRGVVVRRFRVQRAEVEAGTRVVVTIDRTSRGRISGAGDQFGEPVVLEGESSGTLRYVVDPALGGPLRASGTSSLKLSLKSKLRNQAVRQESALTLTFVP
ncbi:MAG: hypothetical protein Q8K82_12345 [Gemmatimonadaceae bacterium]|nr:hypothetical protein [Gemmatimonadaceae bacterium]